MWYFTNLKIKNLGTHIDTVYSFKQNKLTQVLGKNLDKFKSNGAGKSTLFDGISLAIIGETCKKVGKDDFIRNGEKEAEVELSMKNDFLKKEITIKRIFSKKGSARVTLIKNGKEEKGLTNSKNDPNRIILEEIGITREDLQNFFIIGQDNKNSFLTASDTKQKEIIGRFANFSPLDTIEKNLKAEVEELKNSISVKEEKLSLFENELNTFRELRKSEEENFEEWKKDKLKNLNESLNDSKERLSEIKNRISKSEDKVKNLQREVEELQKDASLEEVKNKEALVEELYSLRKENFDIISELLNERGRLSIMLGREVKCPKCNNAFIPGSKLSLEQTIKKQKKVKRKINTHKEIENTLNEKINEAKEDLTNFKLKFSKISSFEGELNEEIYDLKKRKLNRETIIQKIDEIKLEISKVKEKVFKPKKTRIKDIKKEIELIKGEVEETYKQIEEKDFLIYHVGKKGFKTYLANQTIQHIEDMTNYYLQRFTDLRIKINGYKILKSEEVREKIDVSISRDGINSENFYKFSGGEKSVINICCLLALHKLINNSLESGGLNFLGLDEYIISMDEENESKAIEVLSNTGITTMLIMQHTVLYGNNILWIQKKKDISKIITNEE